MINSRNKSERPILRQRAEEIFNKRQSNLVLPGSEAEILKLIHELEVRQIELELENEQLSLLYSNIHDISDRNRGDQKLTEVTLKDKTNLLTNLIINLQEGILLEDSNRKIALTNQLFCDMFGIPAPPEALIGADCSTSAEDSKMFFKNPEKFITDIEQILKDKIAVFNDELEMQDGRYLERDYIPTYIDNNYNGHLWKYRDITQRKLAEEKVKMSEERFRMVFENVFDGISIFEEDSDPLKRKLIDCNEQYATMAERSRDELLKMGYIYPLIKTVEDCSVNDRLKGNSINSALQGSFKWIRPDGKDNTIEYIAKPITWHGKSYSIGIDRDITEYIQKEEELRKLSRAVGQSPVSIVITNLEGNIEYANPKACETAGYSLDELIGQNPRVLKSGETQTIEYKKLWENISTGIEWRGIFHNKRKNGELYWESTTISPVTDADGKITHYLAIKEDITEQKATQEALLKSEERFRQIAEQSQTVIWEVDSTGLFTYVSPLAEKVWGFAPDEMIGKKYFYDLHPAEGREEFKKAALESIHRKEHFSDLPNQIVTRDNRIIWVSTNGVPVLDDQNNLIGYKGADNEITERLQALEELRQSEERYKSIFRNNLSMMMIIDPETGDIKDVNTSACNYYMWTQDEMCSKNISEINLLTRKEIQEEMLKAKAEMRTQFFFKHRLGNGEIRDVEVYSCPISFGESTLLYSIVHDITDRVKAEEALKINEAALNQAQEISMMCSWELDVVTEKLTWSKNYYHLMGIPFGAEMKTDFFIERVHPDDIHLVNEKLDELRVFKKPVTYDLRLLMPDNEYRWIQNNIVPEFEYEKLVRLKGVNIDITAKKQAEDKIRQQNERLSAIIGAMPDLMIIVDKNGTCLEYYSPPSDISATVNEQNIGLNIKDIFSEEIAQQYINKVEDCLYQQRLITYDFSGYKDNSIISFEIRLAPMGTDRVLTFFRDITNEKRKETEIKKLSLAVEQSPIIIVITDLKGNIEYVNPAFTAITGYQFEEVLGQNTRILKSAETSQSVYEDLWTTIKAGDDWYNEWLTKKKNGELYWEDISISPIRNGSGIVTNYLAVKQDITQRKQSEREIHNLNTNLEVKIAERTAQLAQTNENLLNEIEDRKRIEIALSKSEKSYRTVVENVNEVIFQTDAKGLWIFLNSSWEKVTGFTVEESLGQPFINYVHPGDRARNWELFKPLILREKDYFRHEVKYLTKDRGFRWIEVFARLGVNEQNEITGTFGTLQDITERKEAEAALVIEKQRLASIIEGTHVGTWEWNIQTGETIFNERWADILGYTMDEIAPVSIETWMKLAHPDDLKISNELLNKHFAGELDYYSFESRMKHKSGQWIWVLDRGKVNTWDENGKPLLMSGTHQDISEQKQAIDEIEESKERHRGLSEAAFDSIFFSERGVCIEQNSMAEKVFGYTSEEALGHYGTDWIVPEDRKTVMDNMLAGKEEPYEVQALRKDGTTFPCLLSGKMMYYKGRNVRVTSLHDITQRKLAEEALTQMSSRLTLALRVGGIGVWDYDVVNNVLLWDNQMFAIYGIREEDFSCAYDAWLKGLHPDDKIRGDLEIQMAISGEKEFDTEFRVVWPDGSIHFVKALAAVQRDNSGNAQRIIGTNWDITSQKQAANFENEMLQLSTKLTGITCAEIDSALKLALLRIGQFLNADRAYIFEFNDLDKTMNNSHEWCGEDISPEIENLQEIPCNILPNWMENLEAHKNIIIPSVHDLPESWLQERKILEPQGIQSLVVIPLLVENSLIGFVGLDSVKTKRDYNSTEINILKVWSSMLASLMHRKRTEGFLEQTRQNYETFFNTIDDFLWVLDQQGNIIHTNKTVAKRLEYSEEELLHESVLKVHPPDRRDEAGRIVGEMLSGISEFCPVPIVTKSGKQIPVETRVKSGFWNGVPVIFGVSKDISQIQLSEQKFSSAFQVNSAMMSISNFDDGRFLEVNNSVLDTLGYTREDLIGKASKEFNLYVDAETRNQITERLNKNVPVEKLEVQIRTKDGTIKTGLLSADTIFIGDNRCLLTVIMDITERKLAEDELRKARIEADNANLAKSEFLSRMSHELRTPMNSILGFAQLLQMAELKPRQMKGVNHILTSGKHLLKLIDEVLDISRIEAGKLILSPEKVQVGRIINEMLDSIQQLIASRHIKVKLNISPSDEQPIIADRQRLRQALLNLLTNAVKYNKDGGTITISTSVLPQSDKGEACLRISIIDTGNGISEEGMAKVFLPFERIGAEKTQTEGTGLGLAVVKKFIVAMDGNIGVESKPGVGSTFWIELPLAANPINRKQLIEENLKLTADLGVANTEIGFQNKEKEKRADELKDANIELTYQNKEKGKRVNELKDAKSEIDFLSGQNRDQATELDNLNKELSFLKIPSSIPSTAQFAKTGTILYIEDNESNIELIHQTLASQRPNILLVSNFTGKESVRMAIDCSADLILLDLDLPELHGSEVLELLKADEITKNIPVVIVSADAMPHQHQKLMQAGAKDYITKPVDIIAFLMVVDEWIGKRVN